MAPQNCISCSQHTNDKKCHLKTGKTLSIKVGDTCTTVQPQQGFSDGLLQKLYCHITYCHLSVISLLVFPLHQDKFPPSNVICLTCARTRIRLLPFSLSKQKYLASVIRKKKANVCSSTISMSCQRQKVLMTS